MPCDSCRSLEQRAVAAEAALAEARALLREAAETLDCGTRDANNDGWNSGHWCAACDDTVDRNMVLRKRIDAVLTAAEAEKESSNGNG